MSFGRRAISTIVLLAAPILPMTSAQAQQAVLASPLDTSNGQPVRLNREDMVVSNDGRFRFVFQQDGNLVLYQNGVSRALWDANTTAKFTNYTAPGGGPTITYVTHGCLTQFQPDGNLVVYGITEPYSNSYQPCRDPNVAPENMTVMWRSKTNGNNNATLRVQDDGNTVIYNAGGRAVWSTRTCCR